MWRCEHSVVVKAPKSVVWALWTDVANWPKWDTDLSEAALHGELEVGTEGKMKVADDALVSFKILELVPEERFVTRTKMFGAKLDMVHEMVEEEAGLRVTHRAELKGFLGWFWRLFIARKIKKTVAPALDAFAKLAAETPEPKPAEGEQAAPAEGEAPVAAEQPAAEGEEKAPEAAEAVEGSPEDNEVRKKDMHDQIEEAAKAEVPTPEKPEPLVEESVEETASRPAPKGEEAAKEEAAPAEEAKEEEAAPNPANDAPTPEATSTEEKPAEPVAEEKPAEPAVAEQPASETAATSEPAAEPAAPAEEAKEEVAKEEEAAPVEPNPANDAPTPEATKDEAAPTEEKPAEPAAEEKPAEEAAPAAEEKPKEE